MEDQEGYSCQSDQAKDEPHSKNDHQVLRFLGCLPVGVSFRKD
jgi:hypothetical protein